MTYRYIQLLFRGNRFPRGSLTRLVNIPLVTQITLGNRVPRESNGRINLQLLVLQHRVRHFKTDGINHDVIYFLIIIITLVVIASCQKENACQQREQIIFVFHISQILK